MASPKSQASMSPTSSSLDISTRTLDLTRSLAEMTLKGNAVLEAGNQLIKWLARGGISEREFSYCADLIRAKAFPNLLGLEIRRKLLETESTVSKVASLGLSLPGSVGRMMAMDDDYCYIVSTVTAIMSYHDLSFAERCLCNMAVDDNDHRHRHGPQYPYDLRRTRIKPVISKIVESVALDIANAGYNLQQMPVELQDVCGHVLETDAFSAAIMTVQKVQTNVWVLTDVFYVDLTLWVLNHYAGTIEVSVGGKIVFSKVLGPKSTRLSILVRSSCNPSQLDHEYGKDASIKISVGDGSFSKTVFAIDASGDDVRGQFMPTSRRSLYDLAHIGRPFFDGEFGQAILNKGELRDIGATGQAITKWLLRLPLQATVAWNSDPGKVHLDAKGFLVVTPHTHKSSTNVGHILSQVPAILHHNYGTIAAELITFTDPESEHLLTDFHDVNVLAEISAKDFEHVERTIECFPQASAAIARIRERCRRSGCQDCEQCCEIGLCKRGCLGEAALTALLTLLSHVVAEGFGVQSASGISDEQLIKWGMAKLLHEFAFRRAVLWDTWFSIAAIVHTGCPWHAITFPPPTALSGVSCISAVQYGASVMVATWTDITSERRVAGCFGVEFENGYHIQGISDNFAVIQAEGTQLRSISEELEGTRGPITQDVCSVHAETAIIGVTGSPYRLLTMIRSGQYIRIVDPAAALFNLLRSGKPECPHGETESQTESAIGGTYEVWAFDQLLGGWCPSWPEINDQWFLTDDLDSHLKVNVALCLSSLYCVVKDSKSCIQCSKKAMDKLLKTGDAHYWRGIICMDVGPGAMARA